MRTWLWNILGFLAMLMAVAGFFVPVEAPTPSALWMVCGVTMFLAAKDTL